MSWIFCGLLVWFVTGTISLILGLRHKSSQLSGVLGLTVGAAAVLYQAIGTILNNSTTECYFNLNFAYGQFHIYLDGIAAWFLVVICLLSIAASFYGTGYWAKESAKTSTGTGWFFINLLVVSMAIVVIARDAVLFLVAWELMTIASYFLVTYEDTDPSNREAGWIYLIASHIGTAFIIAFFLKASIQTGSSDFSKWASQGLEGTSAGILFALVVVGFGTKAGFVPLHVWLPEAHPAAPSHISAIMSGVMIKTGIYGILRSLTFFDGFSQWWGWLLVIIGLISGVFGVLFALAQHDLKRLLAYHSVENIGIIAMGIGLGILGSSLNNPFLAITGFAAGLLHTLNHAVFKGLLFLCAGSVLHNTDTRNIEELGGLIKKMPVTALTFLVGAVAICGIPPLNGFISEFLIYAGALKGIVSGSKEALISGAIVIVGLGLIGGLAIACFTKAFGIVFLGEPRSNHSVYAQESPFTMTVPMIMLAALCFLIAIASPFMIKFMSPVVINISKLSESEIHNSLNGLGNLISWISLFSGFLILCVVIFAFIRILLLRNRKVQITVTWDCGYISPTPRMQYTASSFAEPFITLCRSLLRTHYKEIPPDGFFPKTASLASETPDLCRMSLFQPLFIKCTELFQKFKVLQSGNLHLYILYIAITLVILIYWALK